MVMNLVLLSVIFGLVIVLSLGIIGVMMCLCKAYRDEIEDLEEPLLPPVRSWVDTYYEVR